MNDCGVRTVVLADRHPLWTAAVEPIVWELGMEVVGKTTLSSEALELVELHRCDVLITGIKPVDGEMNGIELAAKATARVPSLKVIVLTAETDEGQVDAAFRAGAVAYVIKTAHADDLRSVIQQVFSESIFLPSLLTSSSPPPQPTPIAPPLRSGTQNFGGVDLTPREVEILRLAAEGLSNSDLASRLWVGEQTIKFHLSNVYRKLHVANRTEASRWAAMNGVLSPDPRGASSVA
jgi:DNA-binding NarL/FixJ family response regulator